MPMLSRPVYGKLSPQPGDHHLFVACAEGAGAILDLANSVQPGFFGDAWIIFAPTEATRHFSAALLALNPAACEEVSKIADAVSTLRRTLGGARMGLRLYLCGTESLIGQAMQAALDAGIDHMSIQTEHRGSLARRVQCVHCKGITEDVTTQPVPCAHCGLLLFVRDHYSRRLGAFQGVCINAEDPQESPAHAVAFP